MATLKQRAADYHYALIAKRYGMQNSLRIAWEARAAGIPTSLAYAIVEQETGNGANVFGHDPTIFVGAGKVTKAKYLAYKKARGRTRMQGVGPLQLTWWATQDAADKIGGCWVPKNNIRIGFHLLASLIKNYDTKGGVRRYNGAGPRAEAYADSVLARRDKWHRRLT